MTFLHPSQSECNFLHQASSCKAWLFTPSQSECHFLHQASSSEAWRFHIPLKQNVTFCIKPQAPKHGIHIPLNQNATFCIKPRAPKHIFSTPSQSECNVLHQASSSEATLHLDPQALTWDASWFNTQNCPPGVWKKNLLADPARGSAICARYASSSALLGQKWTVHIVCIIVGVECCCSLTNNYLQACSYPLPVFTLCRYTCSRKCSIWLN